MPQVLPRYCPRCGAPIVTSAGTCATCGLPIEAVLSRDQNKPPEQTFHDSDHLQETNQETTQHDLFVHQDDQLDTVPTSQSGQQRDPSSEIQLFKEQDEQKYFYSSVPKKRSMSRRGFMFLLVALLFVLGAIAYIIAGFLGVPVPGFVVIQPPVTTNAINSSVPYAGVDVTVLNAQQSQSFVNDPNSSAYGMVRLNFLEHNQTNVKVGWSYENIARLILPDKSIVSPTYANARVEIAPGAFQKSVVDFAVPTNDHISQLKLLMGAANEEQMLIPLTGNAEVGKYQPKGVNLNGQMQYFGLNWTLTSATSSLSINGQQATKGMRYVTVALKVDNTLTQVAITGSPYDFIRLKYSSVTALPKYTTLPVAFVVGAAGVIGTVSFLVPQNTRSYTLILEPQNVDSGDKASTDFQVT